MARVFIDGFEAGDLKLWDAVVGATIAAAVAGMDGSYCLDCSSMSMQYVFKTLPSAAEYYVAFRWRPIHAQYTSCCLFYNGITQLAQVRRNTSGYMEIRIGTGAGTVIDTGTTLISINTTYLVEVRYKPLDSGGVFQVKVNSILDIDFSGDTTTGAEAIDGISIGGGHPEISEAWSMSYFDNPVIDDAVWIGNTRIQAFSPTAVGNANSWTPSAGDNFDCVNEVPANETDYVATNTNNLIDTYAAANLTGDINIVKCVQVHALAVTEGSPTPANIQLVVRSAANDYVSSSVAVPSTTSAGLAGLWLVDPATSAAWSEANINAVEIGIKAVA